MVEKIYITPGNVRGLGNIVSTKTPSDFTGNYANIIQTSTGDFILSYEGLLLKFNTSLDSTIKDMTAYLYCTVLLEEDNSPVEDLTVTCTFEDATVLTETTDSEGEVTFTWTPTSLGEETVTINCSKQGDYASHTQTVDIRIGLFLSFYGIMTGLTCEDDEYYEGTFETNIEHRSQLSTYIKDIFVADGGEKCVARDGLVYVANTGDLVVEYSNLDQDDDYWNVVFEEEVDDLVGAVCGMSIDSNEDIVLTRLERADIVGDEPVVGSVILMVSSSTVYIGSSVTCTAHVLDEDSGDVEGVTVSFLEDGVVVGSAVSDSEGYAEFTYHPGSVGTHNLTARAGGVTSMYVPVTVQDVAPSYDGVVVSSDKDILSYYDSDSCTLSAQLMDGSSTASVSGVTVEFFNGSTSLGTAQTDSNGVATKTYQSTGVGDVELSASVGSLSSDTYELEDCLDYQAMTDNSKQSRWTIPSAVTSASIFGYSSDGWKFGNASSYSTISAVNSQNLPYSMEFTVTNRYITGTPQPIFGAYFGSNYIMINCSSNKLSINVNGSNTDYSYSFTLPFTVRSELTSTTISVYIDDVLIGSETHSLTGNPIPTFQTGSNRWNVIKDYKIKPL